MMSRACIACLLAALLAACGSNSTDGNEDAGPDAIDDPMEETEDAPTDVPDDDGGPVGPFLPGAGPCTCDSDCLPFEAREGVCVYGICMTRAADECAEPGSIVECPNNMRCFPVEGFTSPVCWPDCTVFECVGECNTAGVCTPTAGMDCDGSCGSFCSDSISECGDDVCEPGEVCIYDTYCVPDVGDGPGAYSGSITCDLPPLFCTGGSTYCGELIQFDPTEGPGYYDYPENGESSTNQYRSWLRRDAVMMIKYATAKTACLAADWTFGTGSPLGLIDMSEEDGSIPGTSVGSPGHPVGTHTDGRDIDVAYYQAHTPDNRARVICNHMEGGTEAYHCTEYPHLLDPWRTALFLGAIYEHTGLRVVGCDGKAGPIIRWAFERLCADGWIESSSCSGPSLTYEEVNAGRGWFYFHHHHMHISFTPPAYMTYPDPGDPSAQ
ncbi:MAG: hypothetical protein JRG91_18930, partial [Deltaproteobacteria bacterium]|nr:hypothetical protein [Deltaproteobacteria bacterium]